MKKFFILLFVLSFLVSGCDKIFPSRRPTVNNNQSQQEELMKIKGPLLARVNNWAMGMEDFNTYLDNLRLLAKAQGMDNLDEINKQINSFEFKKTLLTNIVNSEIIAQIAIERGLDKDEDFKKSLYESRRTLLVSKLQSDIESSAAVSLTEVQDFYDLNKDNPNYPELKKPEKVKLREIVVNDEITARDVSLKLSQGESFDLAAKSYSTAETAAQGGDLGYVELDPKQKFPKYWRKVLSLDKGEYSESFKGDDGKWYIVKVEDKSEGQVKPFDEVKGKIEAELKLRKIDKNLGDLIDGYRTRANVEMNEDLIK